jgi:hypothetical protein
MTKSGEQILEMFVIIHFENCCLRACFKKGLPPGYATALLLPGVFACET